MSKRIASVITGFMDLVTLPLNTRQRNKTMGYVAHAIGRKGTIEVSTPRGKIKFFALRGSGTASAVATFSANSNEPETLEWIDTWVKPGDTLWDIGASIGLYSLYAALDPKVKVFAFEPSGIDFSLIVEHAAANDMGDRLKPFCIALSGETKIDTLHMSKFESGCGGNSIGEAVKHDESYTPLFSQAIPAFTGDDFCKVFKLAPPDHVKLDVDGIEGDILAGMKNILPKVKSLLVEVEGSNVEHAAERIEAPLLAAGLTEDMSCREKGGKRNRLYVRK